MAMAATQPLRNELCIALQVHESDVSRAKFLAIGMLQRRARENNTLALHMPLLNCRAQCRQPRSPVGIGQCDAMADLVNVLRWVKVIRISEVAAEFRGQQATYRGFPGADHSHDDQNHS